MIVTTTKMERIWGLYFEEVISDGHRIWIPVFKNPFMKDGRYRIGINEKFIRLAQAKGVSYFLLRVGKQERQMNVPTKKMLKVMVKAKLYEDRPSMFAGSPPMRIFFFTI